MRRLASSYNPGMSWLVAIGKAAVLSLWLGGGLFLLAFAAPSAFRVAPSRTAAGDFVGAMLTWWHYISIAVPLVFLALELIRGATSTLRVVLLSVVLVLAAGQVLTDLRVRAMRLSSPIPISDFPPGDRFRRQFGMLHALSSGLMLFQILGAAGFVGMEMKK